MPYQINVSKEGKKMCYSVVSTLTGTIHSKCSTKKKAEAQMRLLEDSERELRELRGGELAHQWLYTGKGLLGIEQANYSGAGTKLTKRLKRGDKGKTYVDKIANLHDINYGLAESYDDIRKADERMLRSLQKAKKEMLDYKFNIIPAETGIKGKIFLEDKLGVPKETFTEFGIDKLTNEEINLYKQKKRELEMEGFGKKIRMKCKF
jgi:hypothetical protein